MSIPQQTKYDRWSDKIIEMRMKCERRQSKGKVTAKQLTRNSIRLEDKKFRFSRKKSKYMVIKSGKGKIEEIKESVRGNHREDR